MTVTQTQRLTHKILVTAQVLGFGIWIGLWPWACQKLPQKIIWFLYSRNDIIGLSPRHRIPRTRQLSKDTETVNQPGPFPHSPQSLQTALRRAQILDYLTPHNDVSNLSLHSPALSQLKKLNFQQRAQSK